MILMMREIEDDLSYDELSTVVLDVEAILNSQPLTCLDLDDIVEPLTPSHLISGKRVSSFPIDRSIEEAENPHQAFNRRDKYLSTNIQNF